MMTLTAEHITAHEFGEWLATAKPGACLVYFKGAGLSEIASKATRHKGANAGALIALQTTTWGTRDKVHLLQRRISPRAFEYLAIRRNGV
jgi:hypothetical protein